MQLTCPHLLKSVNTAGSEDPPPEEPTLSDIVQMNGDRAIEFVVVIDRRFLPLKIVDDHPPFCEISPSKALLMPG